jgi:hypothetical protein
MQRLISSTAVIAIMVMPFTGFAQAQTTPPAAPPATETPAPTTPMPDAAPTTPAPEATTPTPDATGSDNAMDTSDTEFDRSNYSPLAVEEVTVEQMTGARVYDSEDNAIGEISDFVVSGDTIEQVILDVGGFLGIGEKPVAIPLSDLEILKENDGDDIRVYSSQTKDALEALPKYEG